MIPEPLDDVDGLAHVFGAIVELNDVDSTPFICREDGADGGVGVELDAVYWNRRSYDPNDFESSDPINQALTAASAALYGVAHAVIAALGFVPALGVVHTGTDRSFVYDIADLYKADISISAAFDSVAAAKGKPTAEVRRHIRDYVVSHRLMPRMVKDLKSLFDIPDDELVSDVELMLWSELEVIASGVNWAEEETLS